MQSDLSALLCDETPREPGQYVSFSAVCLSSLSGVLYFLIQTPSVRSSGPRAQLTSVFPNDLVTEPGSLTAELGQGWNTASPLYCVYVF